jgi:hypothetical protein
MSGCAAIVEKKTQQFARDFASTILENDDPVTIEQGIPSYLLLLDALVKNNPEQMALRQADASLTSAYASSFVKSTERSKRLNAKALRDAFIVLCQQDKRLCQPRELAVDNLQALLKPMTKQQVPVLYMVGSVWASWIQANADDWSAIADMPRVEALMTRVIELDEGYQEGAAHLYLGVLATVLTPALGGRPEIGKQHFERAMALSNGHNLMAKLYYAKNYARGVFDRDLHDKLLNEILAADVHAGDLTLSNVMAQQQAKELLQSADDYF